jgi:hypothetical protein
MAHVPVALYVGGCNAVLVLPPPPPPPQFTKAIVIKTTNNRAESRFIIPLLCVQQQHIDGEQLYEFIVA